MAAGKLTPVSSSDANQRRRATASSPAAAERATSVGTPLMPRRRGPAKLPPGMSATAAKRVGSRRVVRAK